MADEDLDVDARALIGLQVVATRTKDRREARARATAYGRDHGEEGLLALADVGARFLRWYEAQGGSPPRDMVRNLVVKASKSGDMEVNLATGLIHDRLRSPDPAESQRSLQVLLRSRREPKYAADLLAQVVASLTFVAHLDHGQPGDPRDVWRRFAREDQLDA